MMYVLGGSTRGMSQTSKNIIEQQLKDFSRLGEEKICVGGGGVAFLGNKKL